MINPIPRFTSRALHVLRTEGLDVLVKKIHRRLRVQVFRPLAPKLIQATEPFSPIAFPEPVEIPKASLIIPTWRKFSYTYHCLAALSASKDSTSFEVILVDDDPDGSTANRLKSYSNLRVIKNTENLGYVHSCNRAAAEAKGVFLVFLNNDTQVQPGWLDALLDTFESQPEAGMVGSRLIFPDGRQQEAGGIVFRDGSAWNYGRLDDPYRPEYSYLREPDYVSGAALAIHRHLFTRIGGFDTLYAPAYYEDTDLAFRVREAGYRVYYQPWSQVLHFEGVSAGRDPEVPTGMKRYQKINQRKFLDRWREVLIYHGEREKDIERQKERGVYLRAFMVDVYVPTPDRESGSLRLVNLFTLLQELGFKVTFAATNLEAPEPYVANLQRQGVEVLYQPYVKSISRYLKVHGAEYDLVILSRADAAVKVIGAARRHCSKARVVFDTVDLHFLRERRLADLTGDPRTKALAERRRREELGLIAKADTTLVVSAIERDLLAQEVPGADVRILSNIHRLPGRRHGFADRCDILFIGSFSHPPNKDAVLWFSREILPLILAQEPEIHFFVIGAEPPVEVRDLASQSLRILGHVPDVTPYFDGCRLSIAPLRYGAGVKGKINQSLAHGLPVVGTSQAVEGMFLEDGRSVLVANEPSEFASAVLRLYRDPDLWERLSSNGLAVMEEHFGFDSARRALKELVENQPVDSIAQGQVCAVIVAYQPNIDHLTALVSECLNQCDGVILVNNGSPLVVGIQAGKRLRIIEVGANIGLAAAQNLGVNFAANHHYAYVIFFDQDSLPDAGSVTHLRSAFDRLEASGAAPAAVGPCVVDSRDGVITPFVRFHLWGVQHFLPHRYQPWILCDFLIASGFLTSMSRFQTIGNWEEALFIDNVDMEWSFRARSLGFRCFGVATARLFHPLGDRLIRFKLLHRNLTLYLHGASRQYYMMRNRIALYRRSYIPLAWKSQDMPRALLKFFMFSLILGPRWKNLKSMVRGAVDGWRGQLSILQDSEARTSVLEADGQPQHHIIKQSKSGRSGGME
jgi:O-antigen biosynthesis protein